MMLRWISLVPAEIVQWSVSRYVNAGSPSIAARYKPKSSILPKPSALTAVFAKRLVLGKDFGSFGKVHAVAVADGGEGGDEGSRQHQRRDDDVRPRADVEQHRKELRLEGRH